MSSTGRSPYRRTTRRSAAAAAAAATAVSPVASRPGDHPGAPDRTPGGLPVDVVAAAAAAGSAGGGGGGGVSGGRPRASYSSAGGGGAAAGGGGGPTGGISFLSDSVGGAHVTVARPQRSSYGAAAAAATATAASGGGGGGGTGGGSSPMMYSLSPSFSMASSSSAAIAAAAAGAAAAAAGGGGGRSRTPHGDGGGGVLGNLPPASSAGAKRAGSRSGSGAGQTEGPPRQVQVLGRRRGEGNGSGSGGLSRSISQNSDQPAQQQQQQRRRRQQQAEVQSTDAAADANQRTDRNDSDSRSVRGGPAGEDRSIRSLRSLVASALSESASTGVPSFSSSSSSSSATAASSFPSYSSSPTCYSNPAPSMAVFYASVLHSKTKSDGDAFLYGRALACNGEGRRAVWVLDRAGLLLPRETGAAEAAAGRNDGRQEEAIGAAPSSPGALLRIECALLASDCLTALGEWDEAVAILEGVSVYPPRGTMGAGHCCDEVAAATATATGEVQKIDRFGQSPHLVPHFIESGDDPRIALLADAVVVRPPPNDNGGVSSVVHPVARLLTARAVAYDELGNPTRSASFLRAALNVDSKCVQALDHAFRRHLMTQDEERELVLALKFEAGFEWLRDLYLARLRPGDDTTVEYDEYDDGRRRGRRSGGDGKVRHPAPASAANKSLTPPPSVILQQQTPNLTFIGGHGQHHGMMGATVMDASSIRMMDETSSEVTVLSPGSPRIGMEGIHGNANAIPAAGGAQQQRCNGNVGSMNGHIPMRTPAITKEDMQNDRKPAAAEAAAAPLSSSSAAATAMPRTSLSPTKQIDRALRNLTLIHSLSASPEVLSLSAVRAYAAYDLPRALRYCQALDSVDPLCPTSAFVHVATLAGLNHRRPLFQLAHDLVDANPKSAVAWYAVGAYYQTCGRYDVAQRHFCRAARLDPRSAECWIAFGCSFASCDESDQALASFRAAQRLHCGSHVPLLYMGMEYLRTNHLSLAGHFLRTAAGLGGGDPLCWSEVGVWHYRCGEYDDAISYFRRALRLVAETALGWTFSADGGDGLEEAGRGGGLDGVGPEDSDHTEDAVLDATNVENTPHPHRGGGSSRSTSRSSKPPMSSVRFAATVQDGDTPYSAYDMSSRQSMSNGRQPGATAVGGYRRSQQQQQQHRRGGGGRVRHGGLSDLDCVELCRDPFWEPTLFNLGQSYRKARQFKEATICFEKCLSLCPGNASTYSALGYTKHLLGDIDGAIESYHQALSRKPDDPLGSEMLARALHEAVSAPNDSIFATDTSQDGSFVSGGGGRSVSSILSPRHHCGGGRSVGARGQGGASSSFLSGAASPSASLAGITPRGGVGSSSFLSSGGRESTYGREQRAHRQSEGGSHFTFESSDVNMSIS